MLEVRLSPAAVRKLSETHDYVAKTLQAPQAADNTKDQALTALNILQDNPDSGPRLSSRIDSVPERFAETRFLHCGKFIAIYEHDDETVDVLMLYHDREDAFGRFFSEVDI
jgi:plasmid stabilization system protein ParE